MLDFDFICKRKTPSVAGIIYTFGGQFVSKMYAKKSITKNYLGVTVALMAFTTGTGEPARPSYQYTKMWIKQWQSTLMLTPSLTLHHPEVSTARQWN